nr:zinc ribbon domain-containing protein [Anoxybacillus mongoliensis]
MSERTYHCEVCEVEVDCDLNASINLKNYAK